MKGKKAVCKLRIIRSIFNLSLCLCVCMFLQEMVVVTRKKLVHVKVDGLTNGLLPLDNILCTQQSTVF